MQKVGGNVHAEITQKMQANKEHAAYFMFIRAFAITVQDTHKHKLQTKRSTLTAKHNYLN